MTSTADTNLGAQQYRRVGAEQGKSPKGSPHLFKAVASETDGRFDFMVGSFAPMTGPPLHLHREQDDTFYILEGVLTVQVGDETFDIGPGEFLTIPPGVPHTFENLHNEGQSVRAINLMTPGGHFDMFKRDGCRTGPRRRQRGGVPIWHGDPRPTDPNELEYRIATPTELIVPAPFLRGASLDDGVSGSTAVQRHRVPNPKREEILRGDRFSRDCDLDAKDVE